VPHLWSFGFENSPIYTMSILKTRSGLIIQSLIKFQQRWIHSESNLAQPSALFNDERRQVRLRKGSVSLKFI
jgi:hypothetical protein